MLDANLATNADSDTLRQLRSRAKRSKKGGAKGSVALLKESFLLGCLSQDSYPRRFFYVKKGRLGPKYAVRFSKGTSHRKKFGKERVHRCEPHERSPCAPSFEERSQDETFHQERCARGVARDLAQNVYKLKNADKTTFLIPLPKPGQCWGLLQNLQRNDSQSIQEHQCTC